MAGETLLEKVAAISNNCEVRVLLENLVEKYTPKPVVLVLFKMIKLGRFKNLEQFKGGFVALANIVSDWALKLLSKVKVTETETEIDLVKASVKELTGKNKAPLKEIHEAALSPKFGLEFCEPEDAPRLREAYQEQPDGETLYMGMKSIVSDGYHDLFYVYRDGGVRLLDASHCGHPGNVWSGNGVFVFRRPRKVS